MSARIVRALAFTAVWCPSCPAFKKSLAALQVKHPKLSVKTFSVGNGYHLDVVKRYNVQHVPALLFVDAKGNLLLEFVGAGTVAELEGALLWARKAVAKTKR